MADNTKTYTLRLKIDGKEIPNSVNDLAASQRKLKKELRGLEQGTDAYIKKSQQLKQVTKRLDEVRSGVNEVGKSWKRQQSMWSKAKATFIGTFGAMSVDRVISGVQQLAVQVASFIKDLTKQRREITRLTGAVGQELDVVNSKISSIVKTFDQDFNEVLIAANSYAKQMDISLVEALENMQTGFANGADGNGEFLAQLKEYPAILKEAGLSASQTVKLMELEAKTGVFSDKGIDAIKEATVRLRELPQATRDALEAIGISSDQLEKDLRENNISFFEAMQMVSRKLAELPPQSVEVGQALADIFGGPGEDAGLAAIKMYGDLNTELTELETPTSRLAEANERLAMSYQQFADDDGLLTKMEIGLKDAGTAALSLLNIFNQNGFLAGIAVLANPAAAGKYIAKNVKQQSLDENPPTVPTANQGPGIIIPDSPPKQRDGVSTATSLASKSGMENFDFSWIDDMEGLITEFAPKWEEFLLQIEHGTGGMYENQSEATESFAEKFEEGFNAMMDADLQYTIETIKNAEEREAAREREVEATREGFEMLAANAGTVFGAISRLQSDTTEEGIKAAAKLANAQVIASQISVFSSQAAALGKAIEGATAAGAATGPAAIVTIPAFIAAMIGTVISAFASIKENNNAAKGQIQQLRASNDKGYFKGGSTGKANLGFGDQYGPYAGYVHQDEFVLSKGMLKDPYVANVTRYIEESRKYGVNSSQPPKNPSQSGKSSSEVSLDAREFKEGAMIFSQTVRVLQESGIPSYFTPRERERSDDYNADRERARSRGSLS